MKDQPNWFPKVHRMPSEWVMPDHFPDLARYDEIAIDLETKVQIQMKDQVTSKRRSRGH